MSHPTDFITRATEQLRTGGIGTGPDGDTVVLATLNADRMVMQIIAPRGAPELAQIARRLLEEARDICDEAQNTAPNEAEAETHDDLIYALSNALDALPDLAADDEAEVPA